MQSNLTFGQAIEALKNNKRVAREGWNGKGMFIYLNRGAHDFKADEEAPLRIEGIRADLFDNWSTGVATRLPNLNMRSATGSTVTGYLASQTDILAEDWTILDD